MPKRYRPWTPEQSYLLPPSPMDWLPDDHLAYFVLDVVRELDLSAIEAPIHAKDPRGERPYAPRMMLALLLYAYCTGVFSSRKIARKTFEDIAFRVITGDAHPHFTRINSFRLDHRDALAALFAQVLRLCAHSGLRMLGHVSLDGSKVQANASKHKAMSYERMGEEEARLTEKIESLLAQADECDEREDAEHDERDEDIPEELRRSEGRREVIRRAMRELEAEATRARVQELRERAAELHERAEDETRSDARRNRSREYAKAAERRAEELSASDDQDRDDNAGDDNDGDSTDLALHRVSTTTEGKPTGDAQRNFTDPDSRIMSRNGSFMQAFNAQAAVSEDQIIVAHGLTNNASDTPQLQPMLDRIRAHFGELPQVLTADAGYLSQTNVQYCEEQDVDAYISLRKTDDAKDESESTSPAAQMRHKMKEKLRTPIGRERYALRKVLVEPVFGQIKAAMGFRSFSLRGLAKAAAEWAFVCTCHNLLKLFRRTLATGQALAA